MILNIAGRSFDSEEISSLILRDREVIVITNDDMYKIRYRSEREIRDAILYNKLQELTGKDIIDALNILMTVCDYFVNSKEQCRGCLMYKHGKCMLQSIPVNWKE